MTEQRMSLFDAAMIVEGSWEMTGYEPDEETYFEAAQALVDTGMAWKLQGFFGRTCADLIQQGLISAPQAQEA